MKKLGRPKGTKNKNRNEAKYWLPEGISLVKEKAPETYNKDTKMVFLDDKYGEFISSFKYIQDAGTSTHPVSVKERRAKTILERYGVENISSKEEFKQKRYETNLKRYGVRTPLENPEIFEKLKQDFKKKYGDEYIVKVKEVQDKIKNTNIERYGSHSPLASEIIKEKIKQTNIEKYGYDNPFKEPDFYKKHAHKIYPKLKRAHSKQEEEVRSFIQSLGFNAPNRYVWVDGIPRQMDIFVKEVMIAIEYNGMYWHSSANGYTRNDHVSKTNACEKQGIKLIQIFEDEWLKRNKQVKSFLRSCFGKNSVRLHARKCNVEIIQPKEAIDFLEQYHILGAPSGFIRAYGLRFKDELVALITVGNHHRGGSELVLTRFVGKEDVTVRGGLSKLTKAAFKDFGPITTWVDRRISDAKGWITNGWKLVHVLPPDYFYWDNRNKRVVSKQARRKSAVGTPPGMTEREHAENDGLLRLYDCGKIKLIYDGT